MKYYQEITLLPDAEIPLYFLWGKAYQQVHIALADLKNSDNNAIVGCSFPKYDGKHLGEKLRLFSNTEQGLLACDINKWFSRLTDYLHVTSIKPTPETTKYRVTSAVAPTMKTSKLNRLIKRNSIDEEGIRRYEEKMAAKVRKEPYIEMLSVTNGNKYKKFIALGALADSPTDGTFDTYGLSKQATIPWF